MKKTLLTLCCFAALALNAQTPTFDWAINLGGVNFDKSNDITVDATGNVYATGIMVSTADFDPGPGVFNLVSNGGDDIFIAKYNATGNLLWAKNFGSTANDNGVSITVDAAGNSYTTGKFDFTVDFDPGANVFDLIAFGAGDIFILKLDPAGNFIWAKSFGGQFPEYVNDIALDNSGNVYTIGKFQTTTDFDPSAAVFNITASGGSDVFISKLTDAGNFVWAKSMNCNEINSLHIDINNNIYSVGWFAGTVDFDMDTTQTFNISSIGLDDGFIHKLDAAGNFVWAKNFGGSSADQAIAITTDANGNVITTGAFRGTVDFDPGTGTANLTSTGTFPSNSDMFFLKLDASANFIWAKRVGGTSIDVARDIDTDNAGNIYIIGRFNSSTVDFNPDTTVTFNLTATQGSYDAFVLILSAAGNFIYAYDLAGPSNGDDEGNGICVNPAGSFYATGSFYGPIDFDPGASVFNVDDNGNTDGFIQKMNFSPTGVSENIAENDFFIYPNPANQSFVISHQSLKENCEIKIFDVMGKEIFNTKVSGEKTEIDVSKFEKGIYFVQIFSSDANQNSIVTEKIVIN